MTEQHPTFPELPSALTLRDRILAACQVALFLDYDGTLTPIVERPEDARLAAAMRNALRRLARVIPIAVVSGRDLADVRNLVALDEVIYAGSHGFDIGGPGELRLEVGSGDEGVRQLDDAETALRAAVAPVAGAWVERKRFAVTLHVRQVDRAQVPRGRRAVEEVASRCPALRITGGKEVFELRPRLNWHKGKAVEWLCETLGVLGEGALPIYVGDDVTDEDALRAVAANGIGVLVGGTGRETQARYALRGTDEVLRFLELVEDVVRTG